MSGRLERRTLADAVPRIEYLSNDNRLRGQQQEYQKICTYCGAFYSDFSESSQTRIMLALTAIAQALVVATWLRDELGLLDRWFGGGSYPAYNKQLGAIQRQLENARDDLAESTGNFLKKEEEDIHLQRTLGLRLDESFEERVQRHQYLTKIYREVRGLARSTAELQLDPQYLPTQTHQSTLQFDDDNMSEVESIRRSDTPDLR